MLRRKFLKLTGLGTVMVAASGTGMASLTVEKAVSGMIMQEYHFLQLDQQGLQQFVKDYLKAKPQTFYNELKIKSYYLLKLQPKDSYIVNTITRDYIESTDFFLNKMDESRLVRYIGLFNPWKTPCAAANPFTNHFYPSAPTV